MEDELLNRVAGETADRLTGRFLGKVLQLSKFSFVLDFGIRGTFLFISADPVSPRYYLIERRQKDLEKQSIPLSTFGQLLRTKLHGAEIIEVVKESNDKIIHLHFRIQDEIGEPRDARLVVQLTGKTSNLLLLDEAEIVLAVLRASKDAGQQAGDRYQPPRSFRAEVRNESHWPPNNGSPSAVADAAFRQLDERNAFAARANRLKAKARGELLKEQRLKANLELDLKRHGSPEEYKRFGDLLLANIATATRRGKIVKLTDYYSEGAPTIEIEMDPNSSLQDEAARNFRQYTKAKKAREAITSRLRDIEKRIRQIEKRRREIDTIIQHGDVEGLTRFDEPVLQATPERLNKEKAQRIAGVRRYQSSDGYEVWVGRGAKDNDNLTFHLARPYDLWLHAGDYPGSHVIVRNPSRKEIPHRTIIEAAQLAARFSQANEDTKVVVHYSERKFLSKPKGAAPGLVRMSNYRSITVEPKESIKRLP